MIQSDCLRLLADPRELLEVVASVDEVEAAPLVGGKGSENEVWRQGPASEGLPTFLKLHVHLFEFGAHAGAEFLSGHGLHAGFAGERMVGRTCAAGKSSATNYEELEHVVFHLPGFAARRVALKVTVEERAGAAIGEQQVFYDLLCGPGGAAAAQRAGGTELTGVTIFAAERFAVAIVQVFEDGMHGLPVLRQGVPWR